VAVADEPPEQEYVPSEQVEAADTWEVGTDEEAQVQTLTGSSEGSCEGDERGFHPGSTASYRVDHDEPSSSVSCEGSPLRRNSGLNLSQQH